MKKGTWQKGSIEVNYISLLRMSNVVVDGLSPNGKATDSDSVIFKVRILVAQCGKSLDAFYIKGFEALF